MHKLLNQLTLALLFTAIAATSVLAQGFYLISNQAGADSSTFKYEAGDTLYMSVFAPDLNVNHMDKMRWKVKMSDMDEFSGSFTNHFDGYFSAQFDLSQLSHGGQWEWEAELKDSSDAKTEYNTYLTYMHTMNGDSSNDDHHGEFELKGYVQALDSSSLQVAGYVFAVDSNTVYKSKNDSTFDFADIKLGDYVEVEAHILADSSYLAYKVELEDSSDHHHENEMEYYGSIDSIGSDFVDVNGKRFSVTAQTEIKGQDDMYLTLADLSVGMYVKVEAEQQNDGSLWAREIKLKDGHQEDEHGNELEFNGPIDSLGTNYIVINNITVYTDAQTKITLGHDMPGTFSDLAAGMFVEVKAHLQMDSTYLARKIEVEDMEKNNKLQFTGVIDSVGTDFIMVFGYTIYVDSSSEIYGHKHAALTLADLEKGQRVKVKAYLQTDGTLLAAEIKLKDFYEAYVEFVGTVDSLGTDGLAVNGVVFSVDSSTVILNDSKMAINLDQIAIGDRVEIKAVRLDDGSWLAKRIKLENSQIGRVETAATIDSLGPDFIIAGGITFMVDDSTHFFDYNGNAAAFADFSVGQFVEIKAQIQADGSYLALRVKLEDTPGLTVYGATLNGLSANQLIVGGQEITITSNTTVLDANYQPTDLGTYTTGAEVTVWADQSSVVATAVQVKLGSASSVTAIESNPYAELPSGFDLQQNYPNPFNPATTIPFTVQGNRLQTVQLAVYNVLGQKVKTLFSGTLEAGSYRYSWNGSNDFGQQVSSGMYFYKLNVGGKSSIKRMLLMR